MNRKVLLLNRGENVIDVINWQAAVCLLVKGNATAPYGYDHHYKIPVSISSAKRMESEGLFDVEISEVDGELRGFFILPTAIVLVEYANIPYKRAAVNKRNVLKRDKYKCGYCGKHLTESIGSVDHIVPQSRWHIFKAEGKVKGKHPNNWKNVVASCKKCNCKKDNRTPAEAGMKLLITPFVPSKDFLILRGVDLSTMETWDRWITIGDDL